MVDKRGGVGQGLEGMMGEAVGNVSKAMYAKKGRAWQLMWSVGRLL